MQYFKRIYVEIKARRDDRIIFLIFPKNLVIIIYLARIGISLHFKTLFESIASVIVPEFLFLCVI